MCGRYQLQADAASLAASFPNAKWKTSHADKHQPRQQVSPTMQAPVLLLDSEMPTFQLMKWGFSRPGSPLINARKETVLQLPTFRMHMKRRCAIPVTAFYEWQKDSGPGKPTKTPFLIRGSKESQFDKPEVSYVAGLYRVERISGHPVCTFVLLTENATPELQWIHNRQPVFLRGHQLLKHWLQHNVTGIDAVDALKADGNFKWWQMTPDLSQLYKGKIMKQKGLDKFFSVKKKEENPIPGASSSIRKERKETVRHKKLTVQKSVTSFFASKQKKDSK